MTAREIQRTLVKSRYAESFTLMNYTPSKWFECDVFQMSKAGYFTEFEIKLSLSDFKADAKKAKDKKRLVKHQDETGRMRYNWVPVPTETKHEQLARRAVTGPTRFFFVCPKGLITPDMLPDFAGLIYVHWAASHWWSGIVERTVVEAPKLHRVKLDDQIYKHAQSVCYWRMHKLFLKEAEKAKKPVLNGDLSHFEPENFLLIS